MHKCLSSHVNVEVKHSCPLYVSQEIICVYRVCYCNDSQMVRDTRRHGF